MAYRQNFCNQVVALCQQVEQLRQEVSPSDEQTSARLSVTACLLQEIQNFVIEGKPYQEVTKEYIARVLSSLLVDTRYIRVIKLKRQTVTYRVVIKTANKDHYVGSYANVDVARRERNMYVLAHVAELSEELVNLVYEHYPAHVAEFASNGWVNAVSAGYIPDDRCIQEYLKTNGESSYIVKINLNNKKIKHLGTFPTHDQAIRKRNMFVLDNPDMVTDELMQWVQTHYPEHVCEYEKKKEFP